MENSGSHKSYRPLTTLSFRLNFLLSGLNPWPYHLTNVLLHTLTTWLFVHVARLVFCSKSCMYLNTVCNTSASITHTNISPNNTSPSNHHQHSSKIVASGSCQRKGRFSEVTTSRNLAVLLSSLLFALHPIHTEAVAGLVGRADIGCTAFALLSFISYVNFVKYREKARLTTVVFRNKRNYQTYQCNNHLQNSSSNNSSRSHSPMCPNNNRKAVHQQHNNNNHHHSQQRNNFDYSNTSTCIGSPIARFTNALAYFSSFLLIRMKSFLSVSKDDGDDVKSISSAAGMATTTKGGCDKSPNTGISTTAGSPSGNNGYQNVKGSACDRNNGCASTAATTATTNCEGDGGASSGIFGVSGIVGSVFGYESAVICIFWLRCVAWFASAVGFAAAAMLTKEQGITILLVCATYDLVRSLVRSTHLYQVSFMTSLFYLKQTLLAIG